MDVTRIKTHQIEQKRSNVNFRVVERFLFKMCSNYANRDKLKIYCT